MSKSAIPRSIRQTVYERDGGRCQYCHLRQLGQGAVFHINHVLPRSRGGTKTIENLVLQCPYCSLRKANKTEGNDPETLAVTRLFHPLKQEWAEHFDVCADGTLRGKTACGRVTVAELHMNDPLPRVARAIQIQLRLFV